MNRNIQNNRRYLLIIAFFFVSISAFAQEKTLTQKEDDERIDTYEKELSDYLTDYIVNGYEERVAKKWNRDYSTIGSFLRSVEPNRRRWEQVIKPAALKQSGEVERKPYIVNGVNAEWIKIPLDGIYAEGILALPADAKKDKPVPIIIVQHGIGSGPETPFENGKNYGAYAKALIDAGFAVLAPLNLRSIGRRNNIERYARLSNTSIPGIEFVRMQFLLDLALEDTRIDSERVGMWGLSLGGMATMFWMPLEPRIKAGVVSAWFNQRLNKMVIPDDRYSSFIMTKEDYVYMTGWLDEFRDDDVVSLIAPRPLQIQHGKKDRIAHWPQVMEEYDRATEHYKKLDIEDRIDMIMHEGGHEAIVEPGVRFLSKWLKSP